MIVHKWKIFFRKILKTIKVKIQLIFYQKLIILTTLLINNMDLQLDKNLFNHMKIIADRFKISLKFLNKYQDVNKNNQMK